MELTSYVENLRRSLAAAGQAASDEVRDAADRLSYAVEPSLRLTLMEVLGDAAAEVTGQLEGVVVDVRLRGGAPELVAVDDRDVMGPPPEPPAPPPPEPPTAPDPDEGTSRVSLRLPDTLKSRVEEAAAADGLSVNAWLVRAVSQQLDEPGGLQVSLPGVQVNVPGKPGRRVTGWVR